MNKKLFKDFKYLFKYNLDTLIIFELFHKGVAALAILPFINFLINLSIHQAGLSYLFSQNLKKVITNPISIVLILFSIILLVFYIFFEITAVIICIDEARKNNKISLFKVILLALKKSLVILNPKNILLFIFVLIIIPLTNLNFTSGLIMKLKVPEYILDYITSNKLLNIIYTVVFLLLYILMNRWIFSIYEITLDTTSFNVAIRKSLKETKRKIMKINLYSVILFVATYLITIMVYFVGILFIAVFTKYFTKEMNLREIFISRSILFNDIIKFTGSILIFLITITFFLTLYYHYKGINVYSDNKKLKSCKKSMVKTIAKILIIIFIIQVEAMEYSLNSEGVYNSKLFYNTVAVAHRGGCLLAPENTLAALNVAIDSKAKYAEIDVQETKDGKLVLTHDSNLKRTTSINKNIWEATYDEILNYNASNYFNGEFQNETIPTLDEALKFSKNKIKLMIEIKLHGHEKDNIVKKIVDLIKENKMSEDCLIASNKKELLKEVKEFDPNIGTCYITLLAYGEFYNLDYINVYAIESTFVNDKVVNKVHNEGKQIFVWTINKRDKMENLIDLNVDGIITDNPYLVLDALYWKENSVVKDVADYFFGNNL